MEPFVLRDLVGRDVTLDVANAMYGKLKIFRYAPPPYKEYGCRWVEWA